MNKISVRLIVTMLSISSGCHAATVIVPGTSDMWLAGLPDGSTSSPGDSAPTHSPVFVQGSDLSVSRLTFVVSGGVSHTGSCTPNFCSDPDGDEFRNHPPGAINGFSDVRAPLDSLMGVFLSDERPDQSPAPSSLNFEELGLDFQSLVPQLKQIFFIGDGLTGRGTGETQEFLIPEGATRIFLGSMDAGGYFNNNGEFTVGVSAVPLPAAFWLLCSALFVAVGFRKVHA